MDLMLFIILSIAGMAFFALLSRKWGYRIGVGMAKKRMKDLGLTEEDKEAHK
jgi:hypothetical protein